MKISSKRVVAIVSALLTIVSLSRVVVLFLESMASVRDERSADTELITACKSGIARGSAKMRGACLQAHADRASPLVLKSIVRAVSVAFGEFSESISSPFGLVTFVLFLLSGFILPVVPSLKLVASTLAGFVDDDVDSTQPDDVEQRHVIVLNGPRAGGARWSVRRRMNKMLKSKAEAPAPEVVDMSAFDNDGWVDHSLH